MKLKTLAVGTVLMMLVMVSAQTQRQAETLSVQGYPGQASVMRFQNGVFVDVQELARITNGSLSFEKGRITLRLPPPDASDSGGDDGGESGFSLPFMRAAIEAMASIREWGGTLMATVQNGFPVGNTAGGNPITDSIALASAAASTNADYRGLKLLRNEFNNIQAWADTYVKDRVSMSATDISTSEHPFKDD